MPMTNLIVADAAVSLRRTPDRRTTRSETGPDRDEDREGTIPEASPEGGVEIAELMFCAACYRPSFVTPDALAQLRPVLRQ